MSRVRTVVRWLADWRNGATLAAVLVVVVVLLVVNDSIAGRREAFDALQRREAQQAASRAAATRRIDLLQARIDELIGKGEANAALLGQLVADVEALRSQVRSLGGTPVVDATPTTGRTTARTTTTTAAAPPSPSTTTSRPPAATTTTMPAPTTTTTTPAPQCVVLPILCPQGARHR